MPALNPLIMNADDLARYYEPRDEQEAHLLAALRDRLNTLQLEADDYTKDLENEKEDLAREVDSLQTLNDEKLELIANLNAQNARVFALVKQLQKATETSPA